MAGKGTGNFLSHFKFLRGGTPGEDCGIDASKNFVQGEGDRTAVKSAIQIADKDARGQGAQFAKGDSDRAERELIDHIFQR